MFPYYLQWVAANLFYNDTGSTLETFVVSKTGCFVPGFVVWELQFRKPSSFFILWEALSLRVTAYARKKSNASTRLEI